jgi:hypothetical protein
MTEHERDHTPDERVEDLDVKDEESEDVRGGCQNNLSHSSDPVATGRVSKVEALAIKQKVL